MATLSVGFRETVSRPAEARGRYIVNTAGKAKYADVLLTVEPLGRGSGFECVNQLEPGRIPAQFIPDIIQGVVETAEEGVLAGFPLVDLRVVLRDGSFHHLHSTPLSFRIAGSIALHDAALAAQPAILAPVYRIGFVATKAALPSLLRTISRARGIVLVNDPVDSMRQRVEAAVSLHSLLAAQSLPGGNGPVLEGGAFFDWSGGFTIRFSHFEEVDTTTREKLLDEAKRACRQSAG